MGYRLFKEPALRNPHLIACWPGIGNVGLLAVDTLRGQVQAEEVGEIEPFDFFYPRKVIIRAGILENMEFPSSKFYYQRVAGKDVLFFIGEEQTGEGTGSYAEGKKAYQLAKLVLDVAERFGCSQVYTSGAAVALTYHEMKPRVWAVTSDEKLSQLIERIPNTVMMSEVEGKGNQGSITGLNGLLLGMAKKRGLEAISLMGEIPDYLSRAPMPFPKASMSVMEVLASLLGITLDYTIIEEMNIRMKEVVGEIFDKFPPDVKERIEQRKTALTTKLETITDEEEKWIKEHIDELFNRKGRNERSS